MNNLLKVSTLFILAAELSQILKVSAASDMRFDNFTCLSPFPSKFKAECDFNDKKISFSFDAIKPFNKIIVSKEC
jgi:hypothetical protein